jgi:hypothetical protein
VAAAAARVAESATKKSACAAEAATQHTAAAWQAAWGPGMP